MGTPPRSLWGTLFSTELSLITFSITEISPTVEGEGLWIGLPVVIVRLFGCNLRCPWCDSEKAYENEDLATRYTLEELVEAIEKTGLKRVAITGGEPFLTSELHHLTDRLIEDGFKIKIETNGTIHNESFKKDSNITVVCSPKPDEYYVDRNMLELADELKFVVDDTIVLEIIIQEKFADKLKVVPLILQPESNRPEMIQKAIGLQQELLKQEIEARVIPQVHKFMDIP